jgi:hypothetical protein
VGSARRGQRGRRQTLTQDSRGAALSTGRSGKVECFEGSKQHVRFVQKTAARNNVSNMSVHHAVIAKSIAVYGSGSDVGPLMPASQLPPCNVLELDCQGAEVEILRELVIQPSRDSG